MGTDGWRLVTGGSPATFFGVGDGYRTRDLLSHSQAFYH